MSTPRSTISASSPKARRKVITIIGIVVGAIMAIGAVFGALNTMFAAVATRAREIATLRAIGFRGLPVVVAIMLETMLLALIGGVLGGVHRMADLQRLQRVDAAAGTTGQLTFEFKVAPERALDRPEVGACDRLHRRPVPGGACGAAAGDHGVARAMTSQARCRVGATPDPDAFTACYCAAGITGG